MKHLALRLPLLLLVFAALAALAPLASIATAEIRSEPIKPILAEMPAEPAAVELGKKLFFDPRLSKSGFISCNSCHNLSLGGTDNLKTSIGHNWQRGPINSPTVLNSSLSVAQFWDGRAKDLEEQAAGPIANPGEMAFTHRLAVDVVNSIPQYRAEFEKAYGTGAIDIQKITHAIAAFEATLKTPNSPFDRWLQGDDKAMSETQLAGYKSFKSAGCTVCHNGPAAGGTSFQKMGVVEPYKTANPAIGRAGVTQDEADRFRFKVPTLRNVELTYPYFHDGEAGTLTEAVDIMGRIQLGKRFSEKENANIVAFLHALTGDQPRFELPILPPSDETTIRPAPFD